MKKLNDFYKWQAIYYELFDIIKFIYYHFILKSYFNISIYHFTFIVSYFFIRAIFSRAIIARDDFLFFIFYISRFFILSSFASKIILFIYLNFYEFV